MKCVRDVASSYASSTSPSSDLKPRESNIAQSALHAFVVFGMLAAGSAPSSTIGGSHTCRRHGIFSSPLRSRALQGLLLGRPGTRSGERGPRCPSQVVTPTSRDSLHTLHPTLLPCRRTGRACGRRASEEGMRPNPHKPLAVSGRIACCSRPISTAGPPTRPTKANLWRNVCPGQARQRLLRPRSSGFH